MLRLEDVLCNVDAAQGRSRKYGVDPLRVLVEREERAIVKSCLEVLLKELNPVQQQILLMTGLGFTVRRIAAVLNRNHATIVGCRQSITKKLFAVADDNRISLLCHLLEHVKGNRRKKLEAEYHRRYAVREALKNLSAALSPIRNVSSPKQYSSRPTLLFERLSNTGRKNVCRLKCYLQQAFGDDNTVCSLCRKCSTN